MQVYGHSNQGSFAVEIYDGDYTHVSFGDGGIICNIADAFSIMDMMHRTPRFLLRKGWHKDMHQMNPEYSPSWVRVEGHKSHCTALYDSETGKAVHLNVGGKNGTIIATRNFNK